jgi:NADP-dependent 3-hydroxy acid dehydrogenase YdfG
VVTGAAGGIGEAVCRLLPVDGFAVACLDVNEERVDEAERDRILDTNLKGPFLTCRKFLPDMVNARDGCIVSVASTDGGGTA